MHTRRVGQVVPVVVMAALVAFAGTVLLRQPAATTAVGSVTSVRTDEVCLNTAGHDVCLDREHIEHLALGGLRPGDCVDVTRTSDLVVAESLVHVVRC